MKGVMHYIESDLIAPWWAHTLPAQVAEYLRKHAEFKRLHGE